MALPTVWPQSFSAYAVWNEMYTDGDVRVWVPNMAVTGGCEVTSRRARLSLANRCESTVLLLPAPRVSGGQKRTSTVPPCTVHARQSGPLVHFNQAEGVQVGGGSVHRVTMRSMEYSVRTLVVVAIGLPTGDA